MSNYFPLQGGMDLVTPAIAKKPGRAIAGLNYEAVAAGYRRTRGFERFSGLESPTLALTYEVVHFIVGNANLAMIVAGTKLSALSGDPSWRARAIGPPVITGGSAGAGTAVGYIGASRYTNVAQPPANPAGAMRANNSEFGPGTGVGTISSVVQEEAVPEAAGGAWLRGAIEARRAAIDPVPGTGPVRGVWAQDGVIIAVRDNVAETAGVVHYSNITGWTVVNFSKVFAFTSGGPDEVRAADNAIGNTSTAQGTVKAIELTGGSWAAGDAAGNVTIQVEGGPAFQNGETVLVRHTPILGPMVVYANAFTLADAGTDYALPPGGAYRFINHNFYGASNLERAYGVNGVGNAFEFDGTLVTISPIMTGMVVDTPYDLAAHRESLFLGFPGGSIQFSQVGEPAVYDVVVGAGELSIGEDPTNLIPAAAGALVITGRNSVSVLYGNDSSDYVLDRINDEAGAFPYTAQRLGNVIYADNAGIRSMTTTAAYGNFNFGTLTEDIQPLWDDYRRDGVSPVASCVVRTEGQTWHFFDNGTAIVLFLGRKRAEAMLVRLDKLVTCICSTEDNNGVERIFFGSDDGYVYEFNKGTSFDGQPIPHYLRLAFNHFGTPRRAKQVEGADIEMQVVGDTVTLQASLAFDYAIEEGSDPVDVDVTIGGGGVDDAGSNELYLSSQIASVGYAYVPGVGRSLSLKIEGETTYEPAHVLHGVTYRLSEIAPEDT